MAPNDPAVLGPIVDLPQAKYDRLGPYFCWNCRSKMRRWRMVRLPKGGLRGYCPSCIGELYASETPVEEREIP